MKLDKVVSWYQRKISTYDKQQWEKTIEQRILHGFVQVPLTNNTELDLTELIDVDLVRGSSFPKAKPKQGLGTVLKLAILRYVFLPVYARWWVEQTSPRVFTLLLVLYGLQMWCWAAYSYNVHRIASATATSGNGGSGGPTPAHIVCTLDLLVPMALSLVMSMMHSQIVATASIPSSSGGDAASGGAGGKHKTMALGGASKRRHRRQSERVRRKRKVHQRGSEIKLPLTVDSANQKHGTVYIHHPPVPDHPAVELGTADKETGSIDELIGQIETVTTTTVELTGLRKRNVNFSQPESTKRSLETRTGAGAIPDALRLSKDERFIAELVLNTTAAIGEERGPLAAGMSEHKSPKAIAPAESSDTDDVGGDGDEDAATERLLLLSTAQLDSSGGGGGNNANNSSAQFTEGTTSAAEWIGITTNSEEEESYTSELDATDASDNECSDYAGDCDFAPTVILNPCCGTNDRISCTIWEHGQTKKAQMSVLDISSAIIARVDAIPDTCEYVYVGLALSIMLSMVPVFGRICDAAASMSNSTELHVLDIPAILLENWAKLDQLPAGSSNGNGMLEISFGSTAWEQSVLMVCFLLRICLTFLFFFVLAVAERAYKQRFLYAKLFSHLTSSRRARKSKVPHFRLHKVRNIKIWLSVRSYLKRRGPQRSVDVIVSAAFLLCLLFLSFLSVEFLKDSVHYSSQSSLEALTWSCCLGCFLLRFMTLGTKITRKYRSLSVLITEQINLYLQIEKKPHKKEELMVANSVLKLAADLLKELESPFKISGLSANPYLYTTIKVVILSAMSGVLSEMLGFKLKLHKIKIK